MKRTILTAVVGIAITCSSGCIRHLPPKEELNRAVGQSFAATGFNYSSQSRIARLSLPKLDALADSGDKKLQYGRATLDLLRGFSANVTGAVDRQGKKAEALYDFHYNRDNVEVSVRLPILINYESQTAYVGPSFIHTILSIVAPQETEGKPLLIRINIPELLKEESADSPALAKFSGDKRLESLDMEIFNNATKDAVIASLARLDPARFTDQPLTDDDRSAGVARNILLQLGHDDSLTVIATLFDSIVKALVQQGVISENEQAFLQSLTEKSTMEKLADSVDISLTQEIGVTPAGYVRSLLSRIRVAEKEGTMLVVLENATQFDNYGTPRFTIDPEASQVLDISELLDTLKEIKPDGKDAATSTPEQKDSGNGAPGEEKQETMPPEEH